MKDIENYLRKATCLILLLLASNLLVEGQTSDFSGSWKLNTKKSDFGNVSENAAVLFYQIKQGRKEISLKWITIGNDNQEITSSLTLPTDSSTVSNILSSQKTRTTAAIFSKDGKTLFLSKSYSKPNQPKEIDYILKEHWELINEGKELLVELTSPSYTIKAVYDKGEPQRK